MRIRRPEIKAYFEIYRDDELWCTVLTEGQVFNFIFRDFQLTKGVHDYWYRLVKIPEMNYGKKDIKTV